MRKISILLASLLIVLFIPMTVSADEIGPFDSGEQLFSYWETNGYPDNVGYVVYNDKIGKFVVGVVAPFEKNMNDIKAKLASPDTIHFEEATYAYNELQRVMDEIVEEMQKGQGIYSVGIGLGTVDGEVVGFGKSGNELRVVVLVDESIYKEYKQIYEAKYNDIVFLEYGDAPTVDMLEGNERVEGEMGITAIDDINGSKETGEIGITGTDDVTGSEEDEGMASTALGYRNSPNDPGNNLFPYLLTFTLLCAVGGTLFLIRHRQSLTKKMTTGEEITESKPLGKSEVIMAIKESKVEPREEAYDQIRQQLNKRK